MQFKSSIRKKVVALSLGLLIYFISGLVVLCQCSYVDGDPHVKAYKFILREVNDRSGNTPYRFKYHRSAHIIIGIACLQKMPKLPHQKWNLLVLI